jgi:hypothetical protein
MQKYMDVHIYGKCSRGKVKYECSRSNEDDCYEMLEQVPAGMDVGMVTV